MMIKSHRMYPRGTNFFSSMNKTSRFSSLASHPIAPSLSTGPSRMDLGNGRYGADARPVGEIRRSGSYLLQRHRGDLLRDGDRSRP